MAREELEYASCTSPFGRIPADRRSPLKSRMRPVAGFDTASNVWTPGGSQTVASLATGHALPSTATPPDQATPTPAADSSVHFEPTFSARRTLAAADGKNFRSGGRIEFSKYSATRGNAPAARWTSSN